MAKTNTPHAFETIYKVVALPLTKFIAKRTRDPQLTEEIFTQTISAAWKGWGTFKHKSSYLTWLCRIALNKIADYYRDQVNERSLIVVPLLEDLVEFGKTNPTPDELMALEELKVAVNKCLDLLPSEKRQLLQFRYWKDLTLKQIAKKLGISERAVEGKLYRARKEFEEVAKENELLVDLAKKR